MLSETELLVSIPCELGQMILLRCVTAAAVCFSPDPQTSREIFDFALKAICPQVRFNVPLILFQLSLVVVKH